MFFPNVTELTQGIGVVVHARRGHDTQGVKFGGILIDWLALLILEFGEARDNTAAITVHADSAALPITFFGLVGGFQLAQQVNRHVIVFCQILQAGNETRPRAFFEFVKVRSVMHLLCHVFSFRLDERTSHPYLVFNVPAEGWDSRSNGTDESGLCRQQHAFAPSFLMERCYGSSCKLTITLSGYFL